MVYGGDSQRAEAHLYEALEIFNELGGEERSISTILRLLGEVAVAVGILLLREIDMTRGLHHPHIVAFLESGAQGSTFYFLQGE